MPPATPQPGGQGLVQADLPLSRLAGLRALRPPGLLGARWRKPAARCSARCAGWLRLALEKSSPERLLDQGIQARTPRLGRVHHRPVELRIDAQDELPGVGLLRVLAAAGAKLQVVVDRVVECLDDFGDGV